MGVVKWCHRIGRFFVSWLLVFHSPSTSLSCWNPADWSLRRWSPLPPHYPSFSRITGKIKKPGLWNVLKMFFCDGGSCFTAWYSQCGFALTCGFASARRKVLRYADSRWLPLQAPWPAICGAHGWQRSLLPIVLPHTCAPPGGTGFHGFSWLDPCFSQCRTCHTWRKACKDTKLSMWLRSSRHPISSQTASAHSSSYKRWKVRLGGNYWAILDASWSWWGPFGS